ncbi:MAG: bifunctional riboflavin kinase/FAD synthetase [Deltaproteobacteria bacterium]|nr:bifunctional riboflavin kinase/FAD synthetase [Deltaproteobacteria bacterium]
MEHFSGTEAIGRQLVRPVLTVGNFDGIHLGHRAILDVVVERARSLDGEAVVHTFEPHPRQVLYPERAPRLLTTLEQKLELLAAAGVAVAVVEPFTLEYARTSAEVFIRDRLHGCIAPLEVYVGYDFHFGHDREGSMRLLTEMGPRLGFAVTIIPEVTIDAGDVNSTRIRQLLADAEVEKACEMLGRAYTVRGSVVKGEQRGRGLGFPTANLDPENEVLPAPGVYVGHARFLDGQAGEAHPVVTNVGTRPTFEDAGRVVAEAHLIDFDGDLYGRRLELSFEQLLRPERRFESVDALRRQIRADVDDGRRRLGVA